MLITIVVEVFCSIQKKKIGNFNERRFLHIDNSSHFKAKIEANIFQRY